MASQPRQTDPEDVAVSPRAAPWSLWRRWLPVGRRLSSADAAARHTLVCSVALLHVPLLLAVSLASTHVGVGSVGMLVALALLAVALGPFRHRTRALAASSSLLSSSVVLVQLFPEQPRLYGHLFVVIALVSLYQDWAVFGLVVVFAVTEHPIATLVMAQPEDTTGAMVRAGFVLAEAAVLAVFWRADEQAKAGEEMLQAALWEGQSSVQARLEETERIRTDLIGTVSHEFRTPLTCIRGAALTLLKHGGRLDDAGRTRLLEAVLDQQERLSRLLENMLTAARATAADPEASADVAAVAAEVAMIAGATRATSPSTSPSMSPSMSVVVEPGTTARIDRHALHQVLANLVDNAQQHGATGSVPLIAGGQDGPEVWVAVSNEGGPLDTTAAHLLFEPFTQAEMGPTRAHGGLGMGLYVVRRLVDVYGGSVQVRAEAGWVTVEVRLPAVERRPAQTPTALPIP